MTPRHSVDIHTHALLHVQAVSGERQNMLLCPRYDPLDDPLSTDNCLARLVDILLDTLAPLGPNADLRTYSPAMERRLAKECTSVSQRSSSNAGSSAHADADSNWTTDDDDCYGSFV